MNKLASTAAVLLLAAGAAAQGADPRGRWITASGNLEVEIAPCGAALCGTVTRVIANRSMSRDGGEMKPADPRSPLGMTLLSDFTPDGERWQGWIYNREDGRTYRCRMTVDGSGRLLLHAWVGLPLFGRSQLWQRAPEAAP